MSEWIRLIGDIKEVWDVFHRFGEVRDTKIMKTSVKLVYFIPYNREQMPVFTVEYW